MGITIDKIKPLTKKLALISLKNYDSLSEAKDDFASKWMDDVIEEADVCSDWRVSVSVPLVWRPAIIDVSCRV